MLNDRPTDEPTVETTDRQSDPYISAFLENGNIKFTLNFKNEGL